MWLTKSFQLIEKVVTLRQHAKHLDIDALKTFITGPDEKFLTTEDYNHALYTLIDEYPGTNSKAQKVATYLLERGAKINVDLKVGNKHTFLLSKAVIQKDTDWAQFLISHDAEINLRLDSSGPLEEAVTSGNLPMLSLLLNSGGNVCLDMEYDESNSSVLIDAARKNKHYEIYKYLFESIIPKLNEPAPIITSTEIPPDLCDNTLEEGNMSDGSGATECPECPSVTEFILSQCTVCAKTNRELLGYILQYIKEQKLENSIDINCKKKEGLSIAEYVQLYKNWTLQKPSPASNKWEVVAKNTQPENNNENKCLKKESIEVVIKEDKDANMGCSNDEVDTKEKHALTRTFSI